MDWTLISEKTPSTDMKIVVLDEESETTALQYEEGDGWTDSFGIITDLTFWKWWIPHPAQEGPL